MTERRQLVNAWRGSSLSLREFCASHQVSKTSLLRWVGQFEQPAALVVPRFARLEVAPSPHPLVVEVGRARIQVARGFDSDLLRTVVDALGGGAS